MHPDYSVENQLQFRKETQINAPENWQAFVIWANQKAYIENVIERLEILEEQMKKVMEKLN